MRQQHQLKTNLSIIGIKSATLKGLLTASSTPLSIAARTCPSLAFAETATIGKRRRINPEFSASRIFLVHSRPFITGISTSMRMMEMSIAVVEGVPIGLFFQQEVVCKKARASPPWETTWTQDQIRAEEVRRLCWSALSMVSAFLAQAATDGRRVPGFGLSDARSVSVPFVIVE